MPPAAALASSTPGALPAPHKWTDATGYQRHPAPIKAALSALGKTKSLASYHIEVSGTLTPGHESTPWTDPGAYCSTVAMLLGLNRETSSPEALRRYCVIGERYGWTLTRDNAASIGADCTSLLMAAQDPASGVLTVQDQRQPADVQAQERAASERLQAEHKAKQEAQDAATRARAVEWRRVIGADAASLHGATRAQCGPVTGSGWLDVTGLPGVRVADLRSTLGDPCDSLRALLPYGVLLSEGERYGVPADGIRDTIRLAQEAGILMPCKVSVRVDRGNALSINIVQTPADPRNPERVAWDKANPHAHLAQAPARYTPEVESALAVLNAIARLWHWDNSDSMTDYHNSRYFIHVGMAYPFDAAPYTPPASLRSALDRAQGEQGGLYAPEGALTPAAPPVGWRVERHTHSRKQRIMVLAIPEGRQDEATFRRWSIHAQAMGGWYSRRWGRTPGGFAWWADEEGETRAREFVAWTEGNPPTGPGGDRAPDASPEHDHGTTSAPSAVFPTMLACSAGKSFRVLAIERTAEAANAACERTGGGVLCEASDCIVVAALEPETDACEYPDPSEQSPLCLSNSVRLLVACGNGQWGLVLGIDEAGSTRKGEELRRYLATNSYARKPVEISQLPDGRQIFIDAYCRGLGEWRPKAAPNAATQTAAQYREAKAAELRQPANAQGADRVEALAQKLEADAQAELAPRLENTPKRQREAGSARVEGYRMERAAKILRAWAAAARAEFAGLPSAVIPTPTKAEALKVAAKPYAKDGRTGYYDAPMEDTAPNAWTDTCPRAAALRGLLTAADSAREQEQAKAQRKAAALAELRRSDLPGFFPTPEALGKRMIELAGDLDGKAILDPSCGIGSLLDLAADAGAKGVGYDIVPKLAAYCQRYSRARTVECRDFLQIPPPGGVADVVLMNPPFEKGAAPIHVRHALRFLKPGGVLVAVTPSQVRHRGDLDDLSPEWYDVEPGAFASARDAIRQTGVSVDLCVLRKGG